MLQATGVNRLAFCDLTAKYVILVGASTEKKKIFEGVKTYWLAGRETASSMHLTFRGT